MRCSPFEIIVFLLTRNIVDSTVERLGSVAIEQLTRRSSSTLLRVNRSNLPRRLLSFLGNLDHLGRDVRTADERAERSACDVAEDCRGRWRLLTAEHHSPRSGFSITSKPVLVHSRA